MTAKHRKAKSGHKHEDNFFKHDSVESEAREGGGIHYTILFIFIMIIVGGATVAWFCFQQHQTITYLTDNLMGMQMKVVKLQSSQEEIRHSNKEHTSDRLENRLNALEESYAQAQKQVGLALTTAQQLQMSDLPAQVLALHTEMKARLSEMQLATVSVEHLSRLQTTLKGKSEEFEVVRLQVEGLAALSAQLSQGVETLMGRLGETEAKMEERAALEASLSAALGGQTAEVQGLKEQLADHESQLEANAVEISAVRELLQSTHSSSVQPVSVEEQQSMHGEQEVEVTGEALPAAIEEEKEVDDERTEEPEQAPVLQEDAATVEVEVEAAAGRDEVMQDQAGQEDPSYASPEEVAVKERPDENDDVAEDADAAEELSPDEKSPQEEEAGQAEEWHEEVTGGEDVDEEVTGGENVDEVNGENVEEEVTEGEEPDEEVTEGEEPDEEVMEGEEPDEEVTEGENVDEEVTEGENVDEEVSEEEELDEEVTDGENVDEEVSEGENVDEEVSEGEELDEEVTDGEELDEDTPLKEGDDLTVYEDGEEEEEHEPGVGENLHEEEGQVEPEQSIVEEEQPHEHLEDDGQPWEN